jgi:pilus assembly protein Flp/PilA
LPGLASGIQPDGRDQEVLLVLMLTMTNMVRLKWQLLRLKMDKRAVTAIEYALIAALIAVVIIGAVSTLGKSVANTFNKISSEL